MKDGKPFFEYNWLSYERTTLTAEPLQSGKKILTMKFIYDEKGQGGKGNSAGQGKGGEAYFYINDKLVDQKHINNTVFRLYSLDDGVNIGMDDGGPVSEAYQAPFKFNQQIERVTTRLIE